MAGGDEPLIVQAGLFETKNRPRRDTAAAVVWVLMLVSVVVGGVYGVTHRNKQFSRLVTSDYLADGAHCPVHRNGAGTTFQAPAPAGQESLSAFFKLASTWLLISVCVSTLLGVVFLWLFKAYAAGMVRATIFAQVALPVATGVCLLATGYPMAGLFALLAGALAAFVFGLWRNEIDLCGRLLAVAAEGLHANPGLLVFVTGAQMVLLGGLLPMAAFTYMAITNGQVVPNGARGARPECVDAQGQSIQCCAWQTDSWVPAYGTLVSIAFVWTVFLVNEVRVYVIAATTCQWYFRPPASSTAGFTLRAVRLGLTASFGSLCFGAAVLTAIQLVRNAIENARRKRDGLGILAALAACLLECLLSVAAFITRFATIRCAITGESFLTAGRNVTDLLTRNFLKAYGVWWFPPLVVQLASFLLSAVWGLVAFAASYASWHKSANGLQDSIILAIMCFVMALIVLSFFASVLLNVVDSVFICYAMDKDTQAVTHTEVHEVFSLLPVGVAVEQPDGNLAYGAPDAPSHYVPPASASALHAPESHQPPHYPSRHDSSAPV